MNSKPILCLDFDGCVHSYASGWQGADVIGDPPVDGAMKFIDDAMDWFTVAIYSSRSNQEGGIDAMKRYIHTHMKEYASDRPDDGEQYANDVIAELQWPTSKPSALLTIDDRALTFNGFWPDPEQLMKFKPWNKRDNSIYDTLVAGMVQYHMSTQNMAREVPQKIIDHWAEQLIITLRDMRDADGKHVAIKIPVSSAVTMGMALGRANGEHIAYAGRPELPYYTTTVGGKSVRILAIDSRRTRPIVGLVSEDDGKESVGEWHLNGSWWNLPVTADTAIKREADRNNLASLPPSLRKEEKS